jgi:hypothetical protein
VLHCECGSSSDFVSVNYNHSCTRQTRLQSGGRLAQQRTMLQTCLLQRSLCLEGRDRRETAPRQLDILARHYLHLDAAASGCCVIFCNWLTTSKTKLNSVALVREQTIPTEKLRPWSFYVKESDRLCGLVVRVPGYGTEMYCASCEVRTESSYSIGTGGPFPRSKAAGA